MYRTKTEKQEVLWKEVEFVLVPANNEQHLKVHLVLGHFQIGWQPRGEETRLILDSRV